MDVDERPEEPKAIDEPVWRSVLGVDPGHVNCGLALVVFGGDSCRMTVRYLANVNLGDPTRRTPRPMQDIVRDIKNYIDEAFTHGRVDDVVIEAQYGHRQSSVASAILGMMLEKDVSVSVVAPNTLNSRFERLCRRMDIRVADPKLKTARARNKRRHVAFMDAILPGREQAVGDRKVDDAADALIYALYELLGGDAALRTYNP